MGGRKTYGMELKMYFENFDLVGRTLFQAGLNSSHSGNISIFDRKQNIVYIKRSGAMLHALKESDIVTVPLDLGFVYDRNRFSKIASSELPAHIAIYENTNANAIVHCHPPTAVGISCLKHDKKIIGGKFVCAPLCDVESIYHLDYVPITSTSGYGTELAAMLPEYFDGKLNTVLVRGHGSFSIGDTLEECLHYATTLEQACKIFVTMNSLS